MERRVGTISRGIRAPIIREGDDLCNIVVTSVLEAGKSDGFELRDKDVVCITESIVARSQGNYVTIDDVAADVKKKIRWGNSRSNIPNTFKKSLCYSSQRYSKRL